MNPTETGLKKSFTKLLPHQARFVDTFFSPPIKQFTLLRSDVGLGKSMALVALVRRLQDERPEARVLVLAPAALGSQFVEMFRTADVRALRVDRYRFREMFDSTTGGEFWPRGLVAILSRDFACQPDVGDSLAQIRWDLVIIDEAHQFGSVRAGTLRRILASAERVVFATATPLPLELSDTFPADDLAVVEWQRETVVDHDGTPLYSLPRPLLKEIPFALSPGELMLRETTGALCGLFESGTPQQGWIAKSILRSLESSPAALERALQRVLRAANSPAAGARCTRAR